MKVRVLLIEDDLMVARINKQLIEEVAGFEVIAVAHTINQARSLFDRYQPELLLVDIHLPDGNGLELIHGLRTERHSFEAMMISAANDILSVKKSLNDGAFDYLIKPFERSRLHAALNRFLARRSIALENHLTQAKLDQILGHDSKLELPKGIEERTLEQIRDWLKQQSTSSSAEEVAQQVGVSRVTAWRYLEHLCQMGAAHQTSDQTGTGRPIKRYALYG